jgi:hypothetical protein
MERLSAGVSAIIPAFNEAKTLHLVLVVLADCDCFDEVIVVDDGSTDSTALVVASFPTVKYVHIPLNRGKGEALDEGTRVASGQILCFVDADVSGLTCAHICALVAEVQSARAAMAVGRRATAPYRLLGRYLPNLSGERALLRSVWQALPAEYRRGYMVETALNVCCRRWNLPVTHLLMSGVRNVEKETKWGAVQGFRKRLASLRDVLTIYLSLAFRKKSWGSLAFSSRTPTSRSVVPD